MCINENKAFFLQISLLLHMAQKFWFGRISVINLIT